jgi:predicted Zn-dependent protease
MFKRHLKRQIWAIALLLFLTSFLIALFSRSTPAQSPPVPAVPTQTSPSFPSPSPPSSPSPFPPLLPHPLPPALAQWQDDQNQGDYFAELNPPRVGSLVWTQFPVTIYIEQPQVEAGTGQVNAIAQLWQDAVRYGVQEWTQYLPLVIVDDPAIANITILRIVPPLQIARRNFPGSTAPSGRTLALPRVKAAETQYELFIDASQSPAQLAHRCKILLTPNQAPPYTQATARHELGHALGIWGHSSAETDVMYFSQVRTPPAISRRDINTLKRLYAQPTAIGWAIPPTSKP